MKTFPCCTLVLVCKAGCDASNLHTPKGKVDPLVGRDGDKIDVFIGPNPQSEEVFIVDQVNQSGGFDEHKVCLGCSTEDEARHVYLSNYPKGWRCGKITPMSMPLFKCWLVHADKNIPAKDWVARQPVQGNTN